VNKKKSIEKLISGYKNFSKNFVKENKDLLNELATAGQSPKTVVVSCCDSRVEPAFILDCKPGDLFVIRNVANIVPPCENDNMHHGTSAGLEFAVKSLGVENIIILGHSNCGGIKALLNNNIEEESCDSFINSWLKQLKNIKKDIDPNKEKNKVYCELEKKGILNSLKNLRSFDWIKKREDLGDISLHGWYYDLDKLKLFEVDEKTGLLVEL
jgi:carbonic anhydrase